jgi:hypothetical protein
LPAATPRPVVRSSPATDKLARRLGLEHDVVAAIAPETSVLGLLVLDRAGPAVTAEDAIVALAFARHVATTLEQSSCGPGPPSSRLSCGSLPWRPAPSRVTCWRGRSRFRPGAQNRVEAAMRYLRLSQPD